MAFIKTEEEIEKMREGGALLSRALQAAADAVKPGITMHELDDIATKVIEDGGGVPSFKGYSSGGSDPFPSTMCISVNDEVVHGVGTRDIVLNEGDIVGMDIGLWLHGLCTDMAVTVPVGSVSKKRLALMRATRDCMYAGVDAAVVDGKVSDIGAAVEDEVNKRYGIVRDLVGHGVGHEVHEQPNIPNFRASYMKDMNLMEGMCIAIEPMLTDGDYNIYTSEEDGWTILTNDGSDSAHYEVTVVLTKDGPEIITPQPKIRI